METIYQEESNDKVKKLSWGSLRMKEKEKQVKEDQPRSFFKIIDDNDPLIDEQEPDSSHSSGGLLEREKNKTNDTFRVMKESTSSAGPLMNLRVKSLLSSNTQSANVSRSENIINTQSTSILKLSVEEPNWLDDKISEGGSPASSLPSLVKVKPTKSILSVASNAGSNKITDELKNMGETHPLRILVVDDNIEMGGLETTKQIHLKLSKNEQPTIIAVTGSESTEESLQCMKLGMAYYVAKPIGIMQLVDLLLKCEPIKRPQIPSTKTRTDEHKPIQRMTSF
ncbi:hypothetical protein ROZALSC1DRAFT_30101 [Rozella allomycis CSF55]|uniref:Response regulatory domain-containing protein n=1 Tax=Rozella allomycis (strain CSF55) TaxID=988480 RepID=A0A075B1D9_ROZAC|nr:hypothetical protein O9G_004498 [Rozella allomycis CSF55]RKP18178.1 hypothetical protein ROZALSC1DRAFT_30101 [Rozella allomycis CSF55]|eukprot:EPZ34786.1 hypothetical protein O9G_004498 [Rozella allomycis CSF55]